MKITHKLTMGGSTSKNDEQTDNRGLLNGNFINNGNIIEKIESDISAENFLMKIVILLNALHIFIVLGKCLVKFLRNRESRNQRIDDIILHRANNA